jgi:hypothetical protein
MPAGCAALAEAAYTLCHGPMLGSGRTAGGGGAAARDLLLARFLSAQLPEAQRMCRPQLHVLLPPTRRSTVALDSLDGPALEFQRAPSLDLALLLSLAAVVDGGNVVYAWVSTAAEGQARVVEASRQLATRLAEAHSPVADVVVVHQGSAQDAEVLARLMAVGGDSAAARLRQLPLLSSFPADAVSAAAAAAAGRVSRERPSIAAWLKTYDVMLPEVPR